jgi:RNA polymerase primary sigma factor
MVSYMETVFDPEIFALDGDLDESIAQEIASVEETIPQKYSESVQKSSLSSSRENLLLRKAKKQDSKATQVLLEAHKGLIMFWARRVSNRGVPIDDLVQEGNLGMLKAVERFDPSRGVPFASYATWWIRQAQSKAIAEQGDGLPLTVYQQKQCNRLRNICRQFEAQHNRLPSRTEILALWQEEDQSSQSAECQLSKAQDYENVSCSSLDAVQEQSYEENPFGQLMQELNSEALSQALAKMPEKNRSILQWRYGIGCPSLTLAACGAKMGVSRQRAYEIQRRAMRYLRYAPDAAPIRSFLLGQGSVLDLE